MLLGMPTKMIVHSLLSQVNNVAGHGFVMHHGDDQTGNLLVHLEDHEGIRVFALQRDLETNKLVWMVAVEEEQQGDCERWLQSYLKFDEDAWVVDVQGAGAHDAMDSLRAVVSML